MLSGASCHSPALLFSKSTTPLPRLRCAVTFSHQERSFSITEGVRMDEVRTDPAANARYFDKGGGERACKAGERAAKRSQ